MVQFFNSGLSNLFVGACALLAAVTSAAGQPIELRIVGGLATVSQFRSLEEPFWTQEIRRLTAGRVSATIRPFDHSGLRGQDMLHLIRLGVVPFGTALISLVSGDEPEIAPIDLPGMSPSLASLHRNVASFRPSLTAILKERYGVELLGIYAYPAQVLFCNQPFAGLDDLKGRRIRTSSVAQSELVSALGALPVVTAFTDIVPSINRGAVECAITGTLSGNQIGLSEVTSHMHTMSIGWGLSLFAANETVWNTVPPDIQNALRKGIANLEERIWEAADRDTQLGIACNSGAPDCVGEKPARMTLVHSSVADEARLRQVLADTVIPGWLDRCGSHCIETWNKTLGSTMGIVLGEGGAVPQAPTSTSTATR